MTKDDMKVLADELRQGKSYPEADISVLSGCGLSDFEKRKPVRKEAIVMHLRWQCLTLNGTVLDSQLTEELQILKEKEVLMI